MHRTHLLLVLPLLALLLPTAGRASATPPEKQNAAPTSAARTDEQRPMANKPTAAEAEAVVEKQLVKPLAEKEAGRSRFSRAYIPPQARRVRVLDRERATDGRGAEFVAFAIDERSGRFAPRAADESGRWRKDAIVGCVYPARNEVFIKRGEEFFGAGFLMGQKMIAAGDSVCRPAVTRVESNAPTPVSSSPTTAGPPHHLGGPSVVRADGHEPNQNGTALGK